MDPMSDTTTPDTTAPDTGSAPAPLDPTTEALNLVNKDFTEGTASLNDQVSQEAELLRSHRQQMLSNLDQQYRIERKYIEATPTGSQDETDAKISQLNRKYELKMSDLDQQLEPHVADLEHRSLIARNKLAAKKDDAMKRIQAVQDLQQSGQQLDLAGAYQTQLKAAGVSLPLGSFRQPTKRRDLSSIQYEITATQNLLRQYVPDMANRKDQTDTARLGPSGGLRPDVLFSPSGKPEDGHAVTPQEWMTGNDLLWKLRGLKKQLNTTLMQNNVGPMQRAMSTAAGLKTPFANQVKDQTPATPAPPSQRIRVRNAQGKTGTIPITDWAEAQGKGFKLAEE